MLKMKVDPAMRMKTKGSVTICPKKRAILCPTLHDFPGTLRVLHQIIWNLCAEAAFAAPFGEVNSPLRPVEMSWGNLANVGAVREPPLRIFVVVADR
jgi:hypothetical protein